METCYICGKYSLKTWAEREGDGRVEIMEECLNPKCGEDELEDE